MPSTTGPGLGVRIINSSACSAMRQALNMLPWNSPECEEGNENTGSFLCADANSSWQKACCYASDMNQYHCISTAPVLVVHAL